MPKERVQIDKATNIIRDTNIVELTPASSRHPEITSPMMGALGPRDILGSNLGIGFAYIHEPLVVIEAAHKHDFDQYLFFVGGDSKDFLEFDADIELTLDGVVKHIDYPSYVFVPKGMMHCPLIVKRVTKPLVFIDARLTKEASVRLDISPAK
jgi:hypothetical protein